MVVILHCNIVKLSRRIINFWCRNELNFAKRYHFWQLASQSFDIKPTLIRGLKLIKSVLDKCGFEGLPLCIHLSAALYSHFQHYHTKRQLNNAIIIWIKSTEVLRGLSKNHVDRIPGIFDPLSLIDERKHLADPNPRRHIKYPPPLFQRKIFFPYENIFKKRKKNPIMKIVIVHSSTISYD